MPRLSRLFALMVLVVAVVVVMAPLGAFAAKAEVRWMTYKQTEVGEKLMNELKAAFEKEHPDITMTLVDNPFQGFHDRAITLFQAHKSPDVLSGQPAWISEFAELGILEPFDAWLAKEPPEYMGNIPTAYHRKWRGKQYFLPLHAGCVALYWNTEIFKNAGIAGPPTTWDEYVAIAKKVTNPEKKIFATTATLQSDPPTNMTYDIYPLIFQAGGSLIDEKTNKAVFNSPAGVKAIEWYVDLINKHKVTVPGVLSNGEKEKRGNFAAGNIAMMFEGPWGITIQKRLNPTLKYDTAPLPKGVTTGTVASGHALMITTQAQNKDAAWKFVRWLAGPVGGEMWAKATGDFPSRKDVAEKPFFKENKLAQAFVQQMALPNAHVPHLAMPNAVHMDKVMTTEVQNAVQGKKSAKQALDDAAAEWNQILAKYQ